MNTHNDADAVPEHRPSERSDTGGIAYGELIATLLMALAAILTAWSGFQSAKWSGVQANSFSAAGASRTESTREDTAAGQIAQIDVTTYLNWLNAVVDDLEAGAIPEPSSAGGYAATSGTLSGFLYERLRPDFRPVVEQWVETQPFVTTGAPASPFALPSYDDSVPQRQAALELQTEADELSEAARTANQRSDNYVVLTILSALVIFFGGLATKLTSSRNQTIALSMGAVIFLGTAIALIVLPIEI